MIFKKEVPGITLQGYGKVETVGDGHSLEKFGSEKESKGMLTRGFWKTNWCPPSPPEIEIHIQGWGDDSLDIETEKNPVTVKTEKTV